MKNIFLWLKDKIECTKETNETSVLFDLHFQTQNEFSIGNTKVEQNKFVPCFDNSNQFI